MIKYPDGSSYVEIEDIENLGKNVEFTFKINSYEDLWHLNQLVDVLFYNSIGATITIPCLLDAQADRRFNDDQSSGLILIMKFLNNMIKTDYSFGFKIFHPHNPEVVEATLECGSIISNNEFIEDVLDKIDSPVENLILMSSDAGGFKPLMKLCDEIKWEGETNSASKFRIYTNGESVLKQSLSKNDFEGKDILIIDDICVHGGTFKGLSELLQQANCGKLYLAVSHITVQNHKNNHVFGYFDKVFTTNSKYDDYYISNQKGEPVSPKNLEIIKYF